MEVWRDGLTSKVFARQGESISGCKGTYLLLGTVEGFGVALHPSPAAAYSVALVILTSTEVLALQLFPCWDVQPERSSWDKCRGKYFSDWHFWKPLGACGERTLCSSSDRSIYPPLPLLSWCRCELMLYAVCSAYQKRFHFSLLWKAFNSYNGTLELKDAYFSMLIVNTC